MNTLRANFDITVGERTLPCILSMNAFRLLTQDHGIKLEDIDTFIESDPMTGLAALAHAGCKNAAALSGKKLDMGFDQFAAVLLNDVESLEGISQAFTAAMGGEPGNE